MLAAPTSVQAQATDSGKQIRRLTIFDGKLFPSYGDYGANTGPIEAISLDLANPAAGWTAEASLQTEQTFMMRPLGGSLYVPYVDPQGGPDTPAHGQIARRVGGTWQVITDVSPVPVHVFDTAVTADGWFLFGATFDSGPAGTATIWRSTNDGASWTVELDVPSGGSYDETRDAGARFYGVQQYADGTLIANMLGAADPTARCYRRNPGASSAWTDATDSHTAALADGLQVGFTYQGTEFFMAVYATQNGTVSVRAEDAAVRDTIQALIPPYPQDITVTGDHVYTLGNDYTVRRGTRDGVWTTLATLTDVHACSIAVDEVNGWIYYGTTVGAIDRLALPT